MKVVGHRSGIGSRAFDIFNFVALLLLTCAFIYPFLYVFSISISDTHAVYRGKVTVFPVGFDLFAYKVVLGDESILRAYYNTILYSVSGTFMTLLFTSLTAYPLSLKRFYGRNVITVYLTITMFFSGGLIPSYLLIQSLGMMNTIWALIVPGSIGVWNVIIFRTNFQNIPEELRESAYIDGAGNWRILFRIVLPLSKPIIATIGLFTIVGFWNSFFAPLLYLSDPAKAPLQVVLRKLIIVGEMRGRAIEQGVSDFAETGGDRNGFYESLKMAAVIVSTGPILLVYPFIQKYFVKGVLIGSIKG